MKSKKYRGQGRIKNNFNKCSCFHCIGTDKESVNKIKEKIIDKEVKIELLS